MTCPHLRHVVETHQDGGREQEASGDDEEKHVAEIEKSLVLGGSPVPRSQGHHTGASNHLHVGGLSILSCFALSAICSMGLHKCNSGNIKIDFWLVFCRWWCVIDPTRGVK